MSRHVAKLVYDRKCGSMLRKAVLAYFAERANDDGSMIWASKKTIADEIECSKQAVINTVKQFLAEGILREAGHRKTQGGFTVVYDMNLEAIAALPKSKECINQSTPLTGQNMDQSTPLTEGVNPIDPDQSTRLTQTVHEPSIEPDAKASKRGRELASKPDCVSDDVWRDWKAHRKTPFTITALKMIEAEAVKAGWSLEAAFSESIARCWQGFKADWVKDKTDANKQPDNMGRTERAAMQALRDLGLAPAEAGRSEGTGGALPPARGHADVRRQSGAVLAIGHERGGQGGVVEGRANDDW